MFVVTLGKAGLRRLAAGALCCAVVAAGIGAGRYWAARTAAVSAAAPASGKIESAQDIQNWFAGWGMEADLATVAADKVKIPRKWDDSFTAFHAVVQQSGLDLGRYKGKTVEKWTVELPAQSSGEATVYGVLLVYRKKPVGAYLLTKPSGEVTGLADAQAALARQQAGGGAGTQPSAQAAASVPADTEAAAQPAAQDAAGTASDVQAAALPTLVLDAEGYPVE